MADFDLVIRNGTVATAADTVRCDIGIEAGRIVALGEALGRGVGEIDATGRLVLPGGVDSHVHLDYVGSTGATSADDFESGTISAACGGTTTVIPFATQHRGQPLPDVVEDYHRRAKGRAVIDYAFHLILSEVSEGLIRDDLPALIRQGYTSVKVFMTYDVLRLTDRQILDVMSVARAEGALVMVHAENQDCIAWLTEQLLRAGHSTPAFHEPSRPQAVEREATHRAITLAEIANVPILIVHVSGREAIEQVRWAQQRGLRIYAETCPQYLFLSVGDMDKPGIEGAKAMCSPPPRERANQEAVWRALLGGVFHVFSSDHSPYRFDDPKGKMMNGPDAPFSRIANGVPGVETRLPLLFSEGVNKGRIDLNQFVALASTNAAKLYGLYPRKGTIAVGADADIAIWDPTRAVIIRNEILHHRVDYTPYEGMQITGWPVMTLSRGEVVWDDGKVLGRPGRGEFLPCARSPYVT